MIDVVIEVNKNIFISTNAFCCTCQLTGICRPVEYKYFTCNATGPIYLLFCSFTDILECLVLHFLLHHEQLMSYRSYYGRCITLPLQKDPSQQSYMETFNREKSLSACSRCSHGNAGTYHALLGFKRLHNFAVQWGRIPIASHRFTDADITPLT